MVSFWTEGKIWDFRGILVIILSSSVFITCVCRLIERVGPNRLLKMVADQANILRGGDKERKTGRGKIPLGCSRFNKPAKGHPINEGKKKDIRFYKQTGKYTKRPDPNAL